MNVVAVIPARYRSSRFPGKPLVTIRGVPMIVRVARIAQRVLGAGRVHVATDDARIAEVVRAHDVSAVMTSPDALTGTDRLAEVSNYIDADVYLNVQGDEPMLDPDVIVQVLAVKRAVGPGVVVNAMAPLAPDEDPASPHLPKVVADKLGRLVYMSRAAVPGRKDATTPVVYRKQVCVYAFDRAHLRAFVGHGKKGTLEAIEDIEILRFVELGIPVQMIEVAAGSLAVDIPADVARVEAAMRLRAVP